MNRHESYRRIPRDWMVLIPISFAPAIIGMVLAAVLPMLFGARQGDPTLVLTAIASALAGIVLLLIAKLPLYRRGRFFAFGAKALPRWNRILYAVAYVFIGLSVCVLLMLLAVVR